MSNPNVRAGGTGKGDGSKAVAGQRASELEFPIVVDERLRARAGNWNREIKDAVLA